MTEREFLQYHRVRQVLEKHGQDLPAVCDDWQTIAADLQIGIQSFARMRGQDRPARFSETAALETAHKLARFLVRHQECFTTGDA